MAQIDAAEADISQRLVPSVGQAPKTLYSTFPIMQLDYFFRQNLPAS